MENTNKLFISKLTEIRNELENGTELEAIEEELRGILDKVVSDYIVPTETGVAYTFENEKKMSVFAVGEDVTLCKTVEEDRPNYIKLQKENTIMPRAYEIEGFEDVIWGEMSEEKAFYTTIRRKSDNAYLGYCGIKNIYKDELELAIELLKDYHRRGYGSQALQLFMEQVSISSGIRSFKALVDGENVASQAMCEKIGGVPSGIAEHLLHDKEYMEEYEREYTDEITEAMEEAALKFGVPPEKLLTHVLVYRFNKDE